MKDQLHRLLREWAERKLPDDRRLQALRQRVVSRVRAESEDKARKTGPVPIPFRAKLVYAAFGAAAAVLVSICMRAVFQDRCSTGGNAAAAYATISEEEIQADIALFSELQRLFADRLRWVAESNGNVGLGIESIPGGTSEESSRICVRLTLLCRRAGESEWRRAWKTDVLMRGEEMAEIAPVSMERGELRLWMYPLADGMIAADTQVALHSPVSLSAEISTVAEPGIPTEIAVLRHGDREYRLFQTVRML